MRFLPPCGREDSANAFAALALRWNHEREVIRNSAAEMAPAERFRTSLKVSAAGQRPVFPRWRKTETKDTDSVSERTGDGKSCGFPADM